MNNSRKLPFTIVSSMMLLISISSVSLMSSGTLSFLKAAGDLLDITLSEDNAPTNSTTYVDEITTHPINEYASLTYKNVRAFEGYHCDIREDGYIEKDEARGLTSILATFEGVLRLDVGEEAGNYTNQYYLTSGETQSLCGNYFRLTAETQTLLDSVTLKYECDSTHTHDYTTETSDETGLDYNICTSCGHIDGYAHVKEFSVMDFSVRVTGKGKNNYEGNWGVSKAEDSSATFYIHSDKPTKAYLKVSASSNSKNAAPASLTTMFNDYISVNGTEVEPTGFILPTTTDNKWTDYHWVDVNEVELQAGVNEITFAATITPEIPTNRNNIEKISLSYGDDTNLRFAPNEIYVGTDAVTTSGVNKSLKDERNYSGYVVPVKTSTLVSTNFNFHAKKAGSAKIYVVTSATAATGGDGVATHATYTIGNVYEPTLNGAAVNYENSDSLLGAPYSQKDSNGQNSVQYNYFYYSFNSYYLGEYEINEGLNTLQTSITYVNGQKPNLNLRSIMIIPSDDSNIITEGKPSNEFKLGVGTDDNVNPVLTTDYANTKKNKDGYVGMHTGNWGQLVYQVYSKVSCNAKLSIEISATKIAGFTITDIYQITFEGNRIASDKVSDVAGSGQDRWTTFFTYDLADVHLQAGENIFNIYWMCLKSEAAANFKNLILTTDAYSSVYTTELINLTGR